VRSAKAQGDRAIPRVTCEVARLPSEGHERALRLARTFGRNALRACSRDRCGPRHRPREPAPIQLQGSHLTRSRTLPKPVENYT